MLGNFPDILLSKIDFDPLTKSSPEKDLSKIPPANKFSLEKSRTLQIITTKPD
jgi:hypothetical protein